MSSDGALLTLTNLSRLDVSSNDIDHIPEQISCLTGLTYLNVAGNVLAAIPDGLAGCMYADVLDSKKKGCVLVSVDFFLGGGVAGQPMPPGSCV